MSIKSFVLPLIVITGLGATLLYANMHDTEPVKPVNAVPQSQSDHSQTESTPGQFVEGRGQQLYENHCISCHDSTVHIREHTKVRSIKDIQQFVIRWVQQQNLDWGSSEVRSVTDYLNEQFYHFDTSKELSK